MGERHSLSVYVGPADRNVTTPHVEGAVGSDAAQQSLTFESETHGLVDDAVRIFHSRVRVVIFFEWSVSLCLSGGHVCLGSADMVR